MGTLQNPRNDVSTLLIQRVSNGFLAVPQQSHEEPAVFITLKELLVYVATQLGDVDLDFDQYKQDIEIVERIHTA